MPVVGLRQLSRETHQVLEQLQKDGEPVIVTRHGKAIAALTPISDAQQAAALALAVVPEYTRSRQEAEDAIAAGEGKPASQLLAELEAEDEPTGEDACAADELIPTAWTQHIAKRLVRGFGASDDASVEALTMALADVFVREYLCSAAERVRVVNEDIVVRGKVSEARYALELKRVTARPTIAGHMRNLHALS